MLKFYSFLDIFYVLILILSKLCMIANILQTLLFHKKDGDLKGHKRSNKALLSILIYQPILIKKIYEC